MFSLCFFITDSPIAAENKGHAMLKSMGWEQGRGLGKESKGIVEPVGTEIRTSRAGLGAEAPERLEEPKSAAVQRARKMKERMSKFAGGLSAADPEVDMFRE